MRTEEELRGKATFCFHKAKSKLQDKNEEPEVDYYSGAWHALMWILEELDEI